MGTRTRGAAAAALELAVSGTALAADPPFPLAGGLYDSVENGWTTYDCDPPEHGLLTCRFTQVKVMRQTTDEEAAKQKATLPAQIAKEFEADKSGEQWKHVCEMAPDLAAMAIGKPLAGATEEAKRVAARATPVMRKDALAMSTVLTEACETHSIGAVQRFAELGIEQKQRTCEILTNPYTQTFRPHFNADGTFASWNVADTTPQGDCGFINLSRFVPVIERPGQKPYFWQYYARRVTSNRQATNVLGKCSDFEERETLHDWKAHTIFLQCDYIEPGL